MFRRVFIVRHCESEANRDRRAEGQGDSVLTTLGLDQARRRALSLVEHDLTAAVLVSSPLQRAASTAREIASHHGWDLSHDARLMEGDFGWMEGLSYEEIRAHVPEGSVWVTADTHGGESLETVGLRMREALLAALQRSEGAVIVVSHGFAIAALLANLGHEGPLMMSNGDMLDLDLDETVAICRLTHHPLEA